MTEKKVSEAQRRANKKWTAKNKDKQRLYQYRSNAKKFIREMATHDDLIKFQQMIQERLAKEKDQQISWSFSFRSVV